MDLVLWKFGQGGGGPRPEILWTSYVHGPPDDGYLFWEGRICIFGQRRIGWFQTAL